MLMIASLLSGLVFGAGLLISGMVKPTKVLAFLDIFGAWDPSLAVVMVAALAVSAPGFMFATGRSRPLLAAQSVWPTKNHIDRPLIVGAALFGVGRARLVCVQALPWKALRRCRRASSPSLRPWRSA